MKVLVTGATGLLGNNLIRMLPEHGISPICLVRPTSDLRALSGISATILQGPWESNGFLREAVAQSDAVIHSAAKLHIGWREIKSSIDVNAGITQRLAEVAAELGKRFVHISTVDTLAAARPHNPQTEISLQPAKPACAYVVSKRLAEDAVLKEVDRGLDAVIVNPGFMMGPWDWKPSSGQMILALARRFIPLAPAGGCSVVDVRDVCRGIIAALRKGRSGQRYILGGANVAYLDLWREISQVVGRRPPFARLFAPITWIAGGGGDLWARTTGHEGLLNSAAVRMGQMFHFYSSEKAVRELGYSTGPYQVALQDAWRWLVEHDYAQRVGCAC